MLLYVGNGRQENIQTSACFPNREMSLTSPNVSHGRSSHTATVCVGGQRDQGQTFARTGEAKLTTSPAVPMTQIQFGHPLDIDAMVPHADDDIALFDLTSRY